MCPAASASPKAETPKEFLRLKSAPALMSMAHIDAWPFIAAQWRALGGGGGGGGWPPPRSGGGGWLSDDSCCGCGCGMVVVVVVVVVWLWLKL
jgi:hypothetical protein